MECLKEQVAYEIHQLTLKTIESLWSKLSRSFEDEVAVDNLKNLVIHVNTFYDEIIRETDNIQKQLTEKVNNLLMEQVKLKRILDGDQIREIGLDENIPLSTYYSELSSNLNDLRKKIGDVRKQVDQLIDIQHELCTELELQERTLEYNELLPNENQLIELKCYVDKLIKEKEYRELIIAKLREEIWALSLELEVPLKPSILSFVNNSKMPLTTENMNRLKRVLTNLIEKKEWLCENIEIQKEKLQTLWNCLDTNENIRKKFPNDISCCQSSLDSLQTEIKRCEEIKKQNIRKCVEKYRNEIEIYWLKTLKSRKEREKFIYFTSDCFTEDLLSLHEIELNELKEFYEVNLKLFNKYDDYRNLWEKLKDLEAKENDPNRFTNRGGKLLKEERDRKLININLPKVQKEILELAAEYEQIKQKKFTVFGVPIEEAIATDYAQRKHQKNEQLSARKANKEQPSAVKSGFKTNPSSVCKTYCPPSVAATAKKQTATKICNTSMVTKSTKTKAKRNLFDDRSRIPVKSPAKRIISTLIETGQQRRLSNRRSGHRRRQSGFNASKASHSRSSNLTYDRFESQILDGKAYRSTECSTSQSPTKYKSKQ